MTQHRPLQILLIADSHQMAQVIRDRLAPEAYHVAHAPNLAAALQRPQAERPDVILVGLPTPDEGREPQVFAALRSAEPEASILAVTGPESRALGECARDDGADDYLTLADSGERALHDTTLREIVQRGQMERALRWESAVNGAVAELARALISTTDLEEIAMLVLDQARALTGSAFGYVGHIHPQTGHLICSTLTHEIWEDCEVPNKDFVFETFGGLWGWVLENRKSMLINDLTADARSTGIPAGHVPIERFLSAPALVNENLLGQVALANPQRPYTPRDLEVIERLASLYALAIQRHWADRERQRHAHEQATLHRISTALASLQEPETLLAEILEVMLTVLEGDAGWVTTLDPDAPHLPPTTLVARHGIDEGLLPKVQRTISERCSLHNDPSEGWQPGQNISNCPEIQPDLRQEFKRQLCIPLSAGGETLGILSILWRPAVEAPEFSDDFFRAVSQQTGVALQNARLYEAARQVDRLQLLNQIGAVAVSSLDPDRIMREILTRTCEALQAVEGAILLQEPESGQLQFAVTVGRTEHPLTNRRLAPGQGLAGWVAQTREPILVNDVQADPRFYDGIDRATGFTTESLLCAPLVHRDEVIGVLEVVNKRRGAFTQEDLQLVEAVASIAAAALENARLFDAVRQRAEELAEINEIGLTLTSSLDTATIIEEALDQIRRRFETDSVALLQPTGGGDRLRVVNVLYHGEQREVPLTLPIDQSISGWVFRHRKPLLVKDAQDDPRRWTVDEALHFQPRAMLVTPLLSHTEVTGVVAVMSETPNLYRKEDRELLRALAPILSVALENARLYEDLKQLLHEREEAQARLVHTEKIAALGRLVASLAHEINNPLQAVQGCINLAHEEIMESPVDPASIAYYVNVADEEINRIAVILRRMRDFYRPARQAHQSINLHELLNSVLALTHKQLEHSHVTVRRQWQADLPEIHANPDHLKQVFLNFVLNAMDAMPQGGTLTLTTAATHVEDETTPPAVTVAFTDTGEGMDTATQARIFEPFFTTKSEGSGLGLSISYSLIQAHGGDIEVASTVGGGTTMTIHLPLARGGEDSHLEEERG